MAKTERIKFSPRAYFAEDVDAPDMMKLMSLLKWFKATFNNQTEPVETLSPEENWNHKS